MRASVGMYTKSYLGRHPERKLSQESDTYNPTSATRRPHISYFHRQPSVRAEKQTTKAKLVKPFQELFPIQLVGNIPGKISACWWHPAACPSDANL